MGSTHVDLDDGRNVPRTFMTAASAKASLRMWFAGTLETKVEGKPRGLNTGNTYTIPRPEREALRNEMKIVRVKLEII